MSEHGNRLVPHIRVDTSDARVDRLWDRVSARVIPGRSGSRWARYAGAGAAVCAMAGAVFVVRSFARRPVPAAPFSVSASAWDGARLETTDDGLSVSLVDGSTLKVAPRSRVDVGRRTAAAVKLVLVRGRMACDVTHHPERSFLVTAGGVEVRVVGTRFSVATERTDDGARTEVQVERGVVEVRGAGASAEIVRVPAGRSWSQVTKTADLVGPKSAATRPESAATTTVVPPPAEEPASVQALPLTPSKGAGAGAGAPPTGTSDPSPRPAKTAASTDSRRLLVQARGLWRRGDIGAAAAAYQSLLSEHPHDPRAGLAAFELGRLRMDRLRDMDGAVRALERAVALAPGASFREDAMARLVSASAGTGDGRRCEQARDQYLAAYPGGVHRRTVAAACPR